MVSAIKPVCVDNTSIISNPKHPIGCYPHYPESRENITKLIEDLSNLVKIITNQSPQNSSSIYDNGAANKIKETMI